MAAPSSLIVLLAKLPNAVDEGSFYLWELWKPLKPSLITRTDTLQASLWKIIRILPEAV